MRKFRKYFGRTGKFISVIIFRIFLGIFGYFLGESREFIKEISGLFQKIFKWYNIKNWLELIKKCRVNFENFSRIDFENFMRKFP